MLSLVVLLWVSATFAGSGQTVLTSGCLIRDVSCQRAAKAAQVRDEPTQREPATFHRPLAAQRLVGVQNRP